MAYLPLLSLSLLAQLLHLLTSHPPSLFLSTHLSFPPPLFNSSLTSQSSQPAMSSANYILMTTFPNRELTDLGQTLAEAKLLNAVVVQRMK